MSNGCKDCEARERGILQDYLVRAGAIIFNSNMESDLSVLRHLKAEYDSKLRVNHIYVK